MFEWKDVTDAVSASKIRLKYPSSEISNQNLNTKGNVVQLTYGTCIIFTFLPVNQKR